MATKATPTAQTSAAEDTTQRQILDLIVTQDDVSWKQVIFDLIEHEQMDPWDINISLISQKFLEELRKLKEMDFRISGKVVLASAILLKFKAEKLHDEEIGALDDLINAAQTPIDLGIDGDSFMEEGAWLSKEMPKLIPRTPQPRKRKISVYDLVEALEQALETDARRPPPFIARTLDHIDPPENHVDISVIIKEVYDKVCKHYKKKSIAKGSLQFHDVTNSMDSRDVVMTFIPLLHLENARKVHMEQHEHFGPIAIHLLEETTVAAVVEEAAPAIPSVPTAAQAAQATKIAKEKKK